MSKRILFSLIGVLLAIININSQVNNDLKEGYNYTYYPNGKLLSEGLIKEGLPEGYWKSYYTTGVLKSEGNRRNHLLDSIWIFYDSQGDTISKIHFLFGKKNGYVIEYFNAYEDNQNFTLIKSKELYINDLKEGKSYYYYNNSNLKEEVNYIQNNKDGLSIEYSIDGRIITVTRYRKGDVVERERINRYNENNFKEGIWKEFYENYRVSIEANYKNGVLDGYYKKYDENGTLIITLLYQEGKLVEQTDKNVQEIEIRENFDSIRNVLKRGAFKNNIPVGIHKTYDKNGTIIESRIFDDFGRILENGIIDKEGNRTGDWTEYFTDGRIKAKGKYFNNVKINNWIYYYDNGLVEQEGEYVEGKESGKWVWHYDSGMVWKEEFFFNGKEEGTYKEFDIKGSIIKEGNYFDGQKEGLWKIEINDFIAKGEYINDLLNGRWKYYYDDGNIFFEGNFIQGVPDGKHKYYYDNEKLKEERYYTGGKPDKQWKKYDEEGNVIIIISYEKGKETRINGEVID